MYFLLILFFASLFSIIFMIGRKSVMLKNGQAAYRAEALLKGPYLKEWREVAVKKLRVVGHRSLVETIRFYIKSANLVGNKYQEVKTKIKNASSKTIGNESEKQEISKFLKIISQYKRKIRKIKDKIKQEENL